MKPLGKITWIFGEEGRLEEKLRQLILDTWKGRGAR